MKLVFATLVLSLLLAGCATSSSTRVDSVGLDSIEVRRVAALRNGERVNQGAGQPQAVCKAITLTGSRSTRRVCHSSAEWMEMRRNGEEALHHSRWQ